ncbi:hypothetical protein Pfl01_2029 [Pseudomonas fluorescens Pf0-1]|uniref:Uncharacterized protein n=2 Tax=Pseudomonas TaxID=286 RepID=Q3KEN4_PSEPF|nr:hypothetical protein Pfl01_2029 [Pseudomonas fluorescens Pf0-1]
MDRLELCRGCSLYRETWPRIRSMSEELKSPDLTTWQQMFDDQTYWQQSPDAHYFDLQRIADDLLGQGAIDLEQWQILRAKADDLHKDAPAVNVARELDDPEA